jgi:hypothetical protein
MFSSCLYLLLVVAGLHQSGIAGPKTAKKSTKTAKEIS